MADLSSLIRLHKYALDEKQRELAAFYGEIAILEQLRAHLEEEYRREKETVDRDGDIHFTFADYSKAVAKKRQEYDNAERALEKKVEQAKDSMMETFSELKKYEMTQAERERLEEEERRVLEGKIMDDIGLEGFRRKEKQ